MLRPVPACVLAALLLASACETAPVSTDAEPAAEPAPTAAAPADGPELAPAAFEPPEPGSVVTGRLEDGTRQTYRIVGADGYLLTLQRGTDRQSRVPFCFYCGGPREYPIEMERYETLWPLEVGKSVTFRRRRARDGEIWIHTVEVTGTETVETEFGPVDAYVVRQEVRGTGDNRWHGTRTQWYAPQLGWNVRSEWSTSDGESGSWEIAAIALASRE